MSETSSFNSKSGFIRGEAGNTEALESSHSTNGQTLSQTISLAISEHKLAIAATWTLSFFNRGVVTYVINFALRFGTHLGTQLALAIPILIFVGSSLILATVRLMQLLYNGADFRPYGTRPYHLDYTQWNLIICSIYTTALAACSIVVANKNEDLATRLLALPIPLILLQLSVQIIIASVLVNFKKLYPFKISSGNKGDRVRPAPFTIVEDVFAVDGRCGVQFRQAWAELYNTDSNIRILLRKMDLLWGIGGFVVSISLILLAFLLENTEVSFALGWLAPWVWINLWTGITIRIAVISLSKKVGGRYGPV